MKKSITILNLVIFVLAGCAHIQMASLEYPIYKYEAPADFVYLKVLDSINAEEGWVLSYTDKATGVLEIKNIVQFAAEESDVQRARFVVKNLDREHTSLELDTEKSVCRNNTCLDILTRINDSIKKLPARELITPAENV